MKRIRHALCVAFVVGALGPAVARAQAQPEGVAALVYHAEPDTCPHRETFRDAVRARLGRDPFGEGAHAIRLEVAIAATAGELRGTLRVGADDAMRTRVLRAGPGECDSLVDSLAMGAALFLEPVLAARGEPVPTEPGPTEPGPTEPGPTEPGPTEPGTTGPGSLDPPTAAPPTLAVRPEAAGPSSESTGAPVTVFTQATDDEVPWETATEPPPPSAPMHLRLGASLRASLGRLPVPAPGATVGVGVGWPRFSLEVRGRADLLTGPVEARETEVDATQLGVALAPCLRFQPWSVCATGAVGRLEAQPEGAAPEGTTVGYAGLEVGGEWAAGMLHLRGLAALDLALARTTVRLDGRAIWTAPPVTAAVGLEVRLDVPVTDSGASSHGGE